MERRANHDDVRRVAAAIVRLMEYLVTQDLEVLVANGILSRAALDECCLTFVTADQTIQQATALAVAGRSEKHARVSIVDSVQNLDKRESATLFVAVRIGPRHDDGALALLYEFGVEAMRIGDLGCGEILLDDEVVHGAD
jgi:hypothetical protein